MKLKKAEKRLGTWLKVVKQIMDGELEGVRPFQVWRTRNLERGIVML